MVLVPVKIVCQDY